MTVTIPATISLVIVLLSVSMAVSSMAVGVAVGRRREKVQALLAFSAGLYAIAEVPLTLNSPEPLLLWGMRIQLVGAALHVIAWMHFALLLRDGDTYATPRGQRAFDVFLLAVGLLCVIPSFSFPGIIRLRSVTWLGVVYRDPLPTALNEFAFFVLLVGLAYSIVRFAQLAERGVREANYHLGALIVLLFTGVVDALTVTSDLGMPYVLSLGLLASVVVSWLLVTRNFVENTRAVDNLSRALEKTVASRTQALSETRADLMRAEELAGLGRLAAGVAHEINNPATVVITNIQFILDEVSETAAEPDSAEVEEALCRSLAQMRRIEGIVNDLLIAGQATNPSVRELSPLSLLEGIRDALDLIDDTSGVTIAIEVDPTITVIGHSNIVVPVFRNLFANAVDAIQATEREGTIRVSATLDDDTVVVSIVDDGVGMDHETLANVLEPFFTTKPPGSGTGLGLSVSHGLIQTLGGDLRFESSVGRGTSAKLTLVAAK